MDRVQITEELSFSRLAYGMWRLEDGQDTSPETVRARIEACLEQGLTTMDQADIYGGYMSEEYLGRGLTPEIRDRIEVVTKCDILIPAGRHADRVRVKHYDTSRAHIEASVDASLRLMGLDKIDLLLIHRPDPMMDPEETGRTLDDLVASGKVRAVGVSNFMPWDWDLLQSAMSTRLVTNQIEISLAATGPFTDGQVAQQQRLKNPIMAWSPLGGGALMTGSGPLPDALDTLAHAHGVDRAAVAIAWLLAHPARILPVMGTNTIARIKSFSDAFKVQIDRQGWFELYEAANGAEVP